MTPPHPTADFKWKDYCPMAFRKLREVFNIDAGDYMLSVCGAAACMPGRLDIAQPAVAQLPSFVVSRNCSPITAGGLCDDFS